MYCTILNVMMYYYVMLCTIDSPSQSKKKVQRKTKSRPNPHMLSTEVSDWNFQGSRFRNSGSRVPCILWILKCYLHPISTVLFTIVLTQFIVIFVLLSLFLPFHLSRSEILIVYDVLWTIYSFLYSLICFEVAWLNLVYPFTHTQ